MADELPVRPLKVHKWGRPDWLAEQLPAPPFLGIIQAGVKSGKSVLISNLIRSENFYRHKNRSYWDSILLVSPNAYQDTSIKMLDAG
jgi:hypothetical protein